MKKTLLILAVMLCFSLGSSMSMAIVPICPPSMCNTK